MHIGSAQWDQTLCKYALLHDVYLNSQQLAQLTEHARELVRWSAKTNLTTIKEPKAIVAKHIVDSLASVNLIPKGARLLDIGSGGGYPGIPLKIARPDLSVTLIDASRKKITFLKHIIRSLDLVDIAAEHIRIEKFATRSNRKGSYQVCVSRAVGHIAQLITASIPLLTVPGMMLFYQGQSAEEPETLRSRLSANDQHCIKTIQIQPYRLPHDDAQRNLLCIRTG
jgi:16S rRNA (guanine527-N7)-methyltransferase